MKLSPPTLRRLASLAVLLFVGGILYWLDQRRAKDVELVYDLSRIGRTDLVHLRVELERDGHLARETEFFFSGREGMGPTLQRHKAKLAPGAYITRFHLRFARGPSLTREGRLVLPAPAPVLVPVPGGP